MRHSPENYLQETVSGRGEARRSSVLGALRDWKLASGLALALAGSAGVAGCGTESRMSGSRNRPAATAPADAGEPDAGGPEEAGRPEEGGADAGASADAGSADAGPPPPTGPDSDGDGLVDSEDPCVHGFDIRDPNTGRALDTDGDSISNACELERCATIADSGIDTDGDGICDEGDNAPNFYNPSQRDSDLDGKPDGRDNCETEPNNDQVDGDRDGYGAACDPNDANPRVNPGAVDSSCTGEDLNGDGNGVVAVRHPDGTVVIAGQPECECVIGDTRQTGLDEGECVRGLDTCEPAGSGSRFARTVAPVEPSAEVCDERDNDCNGAVDDVGGLNGERCACVVPGATQNCGSDVGVCQEGTQTCGADGTWGQCEGNVPPAETDECDGADNNCDGRVDEAYSVGQVCQGTGTCRAEPGVIECATTTTTRCSTNPGGSQDLSSEEVCDGADNDCDGRADEDFPTLGTICPGRGGLCGEGLWECNGQRALRCSSDANRHANLNPAQLETAILGLCDNADNDCDGDVDEGCGCRAGETRACGTDVGECTAGTQRCSADGAWGDCEGQVGPAAETCDGKDENCDGITDNLPAGTVGQPCEGVGVCADGVLECNGADAVRCDTMPGGSHAQNRPETCDGRDNDCNGAVDDAAFAGQGAVGQPCVLPGECHGGTVRCAAPNRTECSSIDNARPEGMVFPGTCDGVDNDCDDEADEGGCGCVNGTVQACGTDQGECSPGRQTCVNGQWGACAGDVGPTDEVCDGRDNDCDNAIDEGFRIGEECHARGVCDGPDAEHRVLGHFECAADGRSSVCDTAPGGSRDNRSGEELCNGLDDDCDGRTDEERWPGAGELGLPCVAPGACGAGEVVCATARSSRCSSLENAEPEGAAVRGTCDGTDNDCDGDTDETCACVDGATQPCGTDVGECTPGRQTCVNGAWEACQNAVGPAAEVCDRRDNDCDNEIDEGCDCLDGAVRACGTNTGECTAGTETCDNGRWGLCEGEVGPGVEDSCDGKDEDCDGVIDETFNVGQQCQATCGRIGAVICATENSAVCSAERDCPIQ